MYKHGPAHPDKPANLLPEAGSARNPVIRPQSESSPRFADPSQDGMIAPPPPLEGWPKPGVGPNKSSTPHRHATDRRRCTSTDTTSTPEGVRLQKFMAAAGIGSRRRAEELIRDGRVTINGLPATLGQRVDPARDRVALDERRLLLTDAIYHAYLLNKPRGFVCSRSTAEGRTVFTLFPDAGPTLLTAGRLDKNSEGLLLLADNGEWAHRWTHPSLGHEKHYRVTVSGPLEDETFLKLNAPMLIDRYETRPARVRLLRPSDHPGRMVLEFVLREGRNRQIRKMCEQVGLTVHRLVRTRIGFLTLSKLKPGQWRPLTPDEIKLLNGETG